jgi:hypothetical protein
VRARVFVAALAVGLCCARVDAQPIAVHQEDRQHPGTRPNRLVYTDASQHPCDEGQGHWDGPNSSGMNPNGFTNPPGLIDHPAHTHVGMCFPRYGELAGEIQVPFTIKMFHTAGRLVGIWSSNRFGENHTHDLVLDTPLPLVGDPHGLVTLTGHFTAGVNIPHGWTNVSLAVQTNYDNGDVQLTQLDEPIYATRDLSVPEPDYDPMVFGTQTTIESARTAITYGVNFSNTDQFLPIAPISTRWTAQMQSALYGGDQTSRPLFQARLDADLHVLDAAMNALRPGTVLVSALGNDWGAQNATIDSELDPALLDASTPPAGFAANTHRLSYMQFRANLDAHEQTTTLLVINVTVDPEAPPSPVPSTPPVVPPPPTCTPPAVLQGNSCVVPPPPPPPVPTFVGVTAVCAVERFSDGSTQNRCIDVP